MKDNTPDKNFDPYCGRLKNKVYGSLKGKIRLKILFHDLNRFLSSPTTPLKVLDAGCGSAQCSIHLALHGHQLTLCDISQNMLDDARESFQNKGITSAEFMAESIQQHSAGNQSKYDLILCHAVLEWSEEPEELLKSLKSMLKPDGYLSLMFFNRNGAILKSIVRGNFYPKNSGFKFGRTKSLTPTNPLYPENVFEWIERLELNIIEKSGVRVFYDYCEKPVRDKANEEDVLNCELSFSKSEPFLSSARYIHLLCRLK